MRIPELEPARNEYFFEEYPFEVLMYALLVTPVEKLDPLVMATGLRDDYKLAYSPLKRGLDLCRELDRAA